MRAIDADYLLNVTLLHNYHGNNKDIVPYSDRKGYRLREDEVRTAIINSPTIENKREWIPVSERLPVLRGSYKISDDVLITNGFEIYMGYLVERKGKIFWHYYGSDMEVGVKDADNDVTAWMPLPEPYKEREE